MVRRLIQKLESRGVAGVCMEDKLFPKTNSFIDGELQPLADIDEFCGKIKACKDTQRDPDFMVIFTVH
jgi:phosphoenolpyruvate phosphomutase